MAMRAIKVLVYPCWEKLVCIPAACCWLEVQYILAVCLHCSPYHTTGHPHLPWVAMETATKEHPISTCKYHYMLCHFIRFRSVTWRYKVHLLRKVQLSLCLYTGDDITEFPQLPTLPVTAGQVAALNALSLWRRHSFIWYTLPGVSLIPSLPRFAVVNHEL